MVASDAFALVVRQRGGPNLVVHTRGIPGTLINRACDEAVTIMGRFALGRGQTDVDGSGDIHPKFSHDKLLVMNGRYAVVYRLVFKVWVMAVTTMHTNVFVPVRLVETATKGLIATCQVSEVDKDVVSRNYPEVYFMMGAVLKYLGSDLQKAQNEALADIFTFIADTREKKSKQSSESAKRVRSVRIGNQKLGDFNGANQRFNFELPSDFKRLLKPTSATYTNFNFDWGSKTTTPPGRKNSVQSDAALMDLVPPTASAPQTQSSLKEFDDFFGNMSSQPAVAKQPSIDLFGDASFPSLPAVATQTSPPEPQPSVEAGTTSWFDFGSMSNQKPLPPPAAHFSPPSSPQRSGPILYLLEKWEGTFEGRKCIRSNAYGEVGLRKQLWKRFSGKDIHFKITSPTVISKNLKALMKCVLLNQNRSSIHHPGQFAAKLKPSPSPYLKYRLLTGSFDVPIYVSLIAARSSFGEHGNCIVLLIHISTHPNNPSAANGSIFARLPRQLGSPLYSRPGSQFSKTQCCLKWTFRQFKPNQSALFKAVFPGTEEINEEILKGIRVDFHCVGIPGNTLSGLSLSQETVPDTGVLSPSSETSVWMASATARPSTSFVL